ncbi:uncharacterized protein [Onthophagus taurus]|uniref:uncharacterized protein isoform X1 n=1 Tax=Onthophagus taurus TaxID=166361 RepID=UPI000C20D1FE|nr:uncharacterized protein LOC111413555 isoform X2 [Onthophagus taurus]
MPPLKTIPTKFREFSNRFKKNKNKNLNIPVKKYSTGNINRTTNKQVRYLVVDNELKEIYDVASDTLIALKITESLDSMSIFDDLPRVIDLHKFMKVKHGDEIIDDEDGDSRNKLNCWSRCFGGICDIFRSVEDENEDP